MNDNDYSVLGRYYDIYTAGIDYGLWAEYLADISEIKSKTPEILDMGCGCGRMIEALGRIIPADYTGIDINSDMLIEASCILSGACSGARLINASISEYAENKEYDFIYSSFDTVNYLGDTRELEAFLENCFFMMKDDAVLTFDVINPERIDEHETVEEEGLIFVIRRSVKSGFLHTELTISDESGTLESEHSQRLFSTEEIANAAEKTGFISAEFLDFLTFDEASSDSDKIQIILKKH